MTLRPDLSASSGVMNFLSHLYFLIDQPTNCFPSLHVAYPTAATWAIWKSAPRWRLPFIVMTLIVAVSVVLVKQHYILDAVVGCLSALLICFLTSNTERYWKKFFWVFTIQQFKQFAVILALACLWQERGDLQFSVIATVAISSFNCQRRLPRLASQNSQWQGDDK